MFRLHRFKIAGGTRRSHTFCLVCTPAHRAEHRRRAVGPANDSDGCIPLHLRFQSILLFQRCPFERQLPGCETRVVPLSAVGEEEIFGSRGQAVGHHTEAVGPLPAITVRKFQRFRPDIQCSQLIGLCVSRFVQRHRPAHRRGPKPFRRVLFQFRFQPYLQDTEALRAALPAPGRPGIAFPPELPDRRFIQPIMPQERCDCIIAGHLSRKITHPAAISGMQSHPIQFQLRAEPHIQRIFLFHLLFLGSGQGAAAFAVFGQAPFFHIGPQFFLRHLHRKVHDQSLSAPVDRRDAPLVPMPFKFAVHAQFLAGVVSLLCSPEIFPKADLPAAVFVSHGSCPLPFFSILTPFHRPRNFFANFCRLPAACPYTNGGGCAMIRLKNRFGTANP